MSYQNEDDFNKLWEKSITNLTESNHDELNNKSSVRLIKSINNWDSVRYESFTNDNTNLISCKKCNTKFNINDDNLIREHGTKCLYNI